jgi:hypothetical protein
LAPQEVLKRQMSESGWLACYPGSFLPRKDYETSKKIKTKDRNRRIGGWKEAKKGDQVKNDDDNDDENNISEEGFGLDLGILKQAGHSHLPLSTEMDVYAGGKRKLRPMTCQRCGSNDHTAPKCDSEDISFLLRKLHVFPKADESMPSVIDISSSFDSTRFVSFAALCRAYPDLTDAHDTDQRGCELPIALNLFNSGSVLKQVAAPLVPGRRHSRVPSDVIDLLEERLKEKRSGTAKSIAQSIQNVMRDKGVVIPLGKLQDQIREVAQYSQKKGVWELKSNEEVEVATKNDMVGRETLQSERNSAEVLLPEGSQSRLVPLTNSTVVNVENNCFILSDDSESNVLLAKVATVAKKIKELGEPVSVNVLSNRATLLGHMESKQLKYLNNVWDDKEHEWYHLVLVGDFDDLRKKMDGEKARYDTALEEVKRLWSLAKPVDLECDLPGCSNLCGSHSMWGLDGYCQQCWIFQTKDLVNVNLDIVIGDIHLNAFAILNHVALESGWMHGDELDACVEMLRQFAPKGTFLASTDEWTTMEKHDFVTQPRFVAGARRRINGAKRILYPFNVNNAHWEIALVDVDGHTLSVYDSLRIRPDLTRVTKALSLIHEIDEWTIIYPTCGKQADSTSCGPFVVHHMKLLMLNLSVTGRNVPRTSTKGCLEDTRKLREQIARELLLQRLDDSIVLANWPYQRK